MRHLTLLASAALVALLATIVVHTAAVQAQAAPDESVMATWEGDGLKYGETSFTKSASPETDQNVPGLLSNSEGANPCEANQNVYYSSIGTRNDDDNKYYWMYVICLTADFNGDKSKQTPARLLEYRVPRSDHKLGTDTARNFNTHGEYKGYRIWVAAEGTDSSGNPINGGGDTATTTATTCDSKFTHGIGWIICPITNWLADGMDQLYKVLTSFLTVTPLSTTKNSTMYYIWDVMRNFANILFIFGFLIIIYSQITNVGLSSYGIKQLLPRLIIAAVLVNISYWIVAVAVDLSNVLGVTIKDTFDQVVANVPKNANNPDMSWDALSWQAIAGAALSGGAALYVAGGAVVGLVASAGGSLWLLLVGLAGVMLSALVAILILAARQALITILVIISPLAFVAYLLPGTEKYFHRWRELLTTMLLVFPIFAVVFGGAHLAGIAIIYSADPSSSNYLNLIILGMIVQIAPIIITPLLIRVSGSLLGKIAGIVNNPNKGIVDGTRKFAEGRRDRTKQRQISDRNANGELKNYNPLAMGARKLALREIDRNQKLKAWEGGIESQYAQDHRSHEVHRQHELNEMIKTTGESHSKADFEGQLATNELLRRLYYSQQQNREHAEEASKNIATQWEGLKANPNVVGANEEERRIGEEARKISDTTKGLAYREAAAKQVIDKNYHEQLAKDKSMQEFAGFSDVDQYGASRVANIAQEAEFKARSARIAAADAAMGRADATVEEMQGVILGNEAAAGRFKDFVKDADSRSAALRRLMETAPMYAVQHVQETLDLSRNASSNPALAALRSEMAAALVKRKLFYISNTHRNEMAEGTLDPKYLHGPGRNLMMQETLNLSGLDAETMVHADRDELKAVLAFLEDDNFGLKSLETHAQESLRKSLNLAFTDDRYAGVMGKRRTELNAIRAKLGLPRIN